LPCPSRAKGGRPPYLTILMTKILILQQLDNPAGDALEYQLLDRRSFLQFLGLTENGAIPDVKTIWLLRDRLAQAGVGAKLFDVPQQLLAHRTLAARCGRLLPKCDLGGQLRLAGLCR
jgi:IS5 family transposase